MKKNVKINKQWTLFGAGNFTCELIDCIYANSGLVKEIVLNIEIEQKILNRIPNDIKIITLKEFKPSECNYFLGFMDCNKEDILEKLKNYDLKFSNLVHPFSNIAHDVKIGQGNFIGAGTVIASQVELGNYNFINRACSIGHNSVLGDLNKFGPNVTVCSFCKIKNKNFLGAGSIIKEKISIYSNITIGAGAVVLKDINKEGIYCGIPAKIQNI